MSTKKAASASDPSDWITQAEAARLRQVSRQAIAKLVGSGRLRVVSFGGRSFVSRQEVLAFSALPPGRRKVKAGDE